MIRLIARRAGDDFEAQLIAEAIEGEGAEVISIAYDGQHQRQGALAPCSRFVVFARVPERVSINDIDGRIERSLDRASR